MYMEWYDNIKEKLADFLEKMSEDDFSYFRYSLTGDLYDKKTDWGLGNSVFAVKILAITGLLNSLDEKKRNNLYEKIIKFTDEVVYIRDPLIAELSLTDRIISMFSKVQKKKLDFNIENIHRAETRQAFAALYLLGRKPLKPFAYIPYTDKEIDIYLNSFDWSQPWSAGSHFSHLLFFLKMNARFFEYKVQESQGLIRFAFDWISRIQSNNDGSWYQSDNVPLTIKINGAMKILTGLQAAGINDFPYADKLIDLALSGINDQEACSNFNIVYVLYCCNRILPNYRKGEIDYFLRQRLNLYQEFYHPAEGGFSFNRNKANEFYYGKRLSQGKNEPDIHGTIMFVWGISLIDKMLNLGLNFKIVEN
jgi:hypothetical protein